MKIAVIIIRVLMGLMFLMSSLGFFFHLFPIPELKGNVKLFMEGMIASVYLLPLVKIVELLCGIAFVSGRFVTLATVVIFPNVVNILLFHAFVEPEGLLVAVLLFLGNLFLAFAYRKNYAPLFRVK
jgi:putative oxidoreductase